MERGTTCPVAGRSPLPIGQVTLYWGVVPVDCHFSYGSPSTFAFLLAGVRSGALTGWGETLLVHPEPSATLAQSLLGQDARQLDGLLLPLATDRQHLYAEAFSLALHDLVAQALGLPLCELLGQPARREVPVMPCVFPRDAADAAARAGRLLAYGVRHLKVKLMGEAGVDLAHLRAIRQVAGPGIPLQGDANEGYGPEELQAGLLTELVQAGLDVIEDPCPGGPEVYRRLRRPEGPRVMVDAMARNDALLEQGLATGAVDLVNLHPCQQGTLTHLLERTRMTRQYGGSEVVGGTGYVGIGSAAYWHVAAVVGLNGPCGEVGGALDHGQPEIHPLPRLHGGTVVLSDKPGHGATPDLQRLDPYLEGMQTIT